MNKNVKNALTIILMLLFLGFLISILSIVVKKHNNSDSNSEKPNITETEIITETYEIPLTLASLETSVDKLGYKYELCIEDFLPEITEKEWVNYLDYQKYKLEQKNPLIKIKNIEFEGTRINIYHNLTIDNSTYGGSVYQNSILSEPINFGVTVIPNKLNKSFFYDYLFTGKTSYSVLIMDLSLNKLPTHYNSNFELVYDSKISFTKNLIFKVEVEKTKENENIKLFYDNILEAPQNYNSELKTNINITQLN